MNTKQKNPSPTFAALLAKQHALKAHETYELMRIALQLANLTPASPVSLATLAALAAQIPPAHSVFVLERGYSHQSGVAALAGYRLAVASELNLLPEVNGLPLPLVLASAAQIANINLLACEVDAAALWASGLVTPLPEQRNQVARLGKLLGIEHVVLRSFDATVSAGAKFAGELKATGADSCASLLTKLRENSGFGVRDLYTKAGIKNPTRTLQNRFSMITSQGRHVTENDRGWMKKLAKAFPEIGLLAQFEIELRAARHRPGASRRDVASYWNAAIEGQWARVVEHKRSWAHAQSPTNRPWCDSSVTKVRQDLGYFLGHLKTPPNSNEPRLNGAGIKESELNLGLLAIPDLWEPYFEFRAARAFAGRPCRGHAAIADIVGSLVRPDTGVLWLQAAFFAKLPGVLARCPALPHDIACTGDVDAWRFREACRQTHEKLKGISKTLHFDPRVARPSREPARKIDRVLANYQRYPLEALAELILRIEAALPERVTTAEEAILQRLLVVLHIAAYRPLRSCVWTNISDEMIILGQNSTVSLAIPPRLIKNRGSRAARTGCHKTLPERAAAEVMRYLHEGRPILAALAEGPASDRFLLNHHGEPLSIAALSEQLKRVTLQFAPHLFPRGLSFHDLRHLVGSDLVRRFGHELGGRLTGEALLINFGTALEVYVHQALDALRWDGPATQEAAYEDAFLCAERTLRRQKKTA